MKKTQNRSRKLTGRVPKKKKRKMKIDQRNNDIPSEEILQLQLLPSTVTKPSATACWAFSGSAKITYFNEIQQKTIVERNHSALRSIVKMKRL